MAYADVADVKARLGRYAGVLAAAGSPQHPNEDDATEFLANVTAEINAAIESRGFDPDTLSANSITALKDLAAFGAIARILAGVPPDDDLAKIHEYARKVWGAAMGDPTAFALEAIRGSFRMGSHPVIADLESGSGAGAPGASAGDFWSENLGYGSPAQIRAAAEASWPSTAPTFEKGMSA
jgi:hypothetical protein